ncbi:MAG TPA: alanine--tRNA ligase [Tepidisphaeraceae bacterium]|nr:alanine--tRNA ligase [Tepidisphaeraceae bacterium]
MTSDQIRQTFIDFFVQKHGHTFVPSSPVVPLDDPTLLFTNAGMNQFKPIFLGQEKRAYTRAANTQKCIRAGGKHNDLDDVGRSRRHHTFFEMLGNWSFGDYFKQGAIEMAWELLTKVYKLDPKRLHVSCYKGDEKNGIPKDTEAAEIWKKVAHLPDDHIHYFGKDNFWEMGETGPCGPCTEIYYDRRPEAELHTPSPVNGEDPRVMEIWNNVFIQYNRDAAGKLTTLPAQHVDTGMGLERLCQVLQDKQDNFGTDLWTPLFDAISQISNLKYTGKFPKTNAADPVAEAADPQLRHDIAFRVVADHIRCLTFALTDGAVPSNEGRGYVLRRILRRAVRFGRQQLGLNEPFLFKLVPVVVESMGKMFPELKTNPGRVIELVKDEEVSFGRTLGRGIQLFEDAASAAIARVFPRESDTAQKQYRTIGLRDKIHTEDGHEVDIPADADARRRLIEKYAAHAVQISAEDAFKLHDTYGFPIDLTRIMAEERGMSLDVAGYEKLMEKAKEQARPGGTGDKSHGSDLSPDAIAKLQGEKIIPTDDRSKFDAQSTTATRSATVQAVWDGTQFLPEVPGCEPRAHVDANGMFAVILDHTNFYAEMGGQVGDQGELRGGGFGTTKGGGANFIVKSTRSVAGYILHIGFCVAGPLKVGTQVDLNVSAQRSHTEKNHTSTHLANWALREVLGDDVQQKGSLVDPEKLRFDYSHGKALADEELAKVESLVNDKIAAKLPVYAETAPQEQALKIHGLRAVFGEKYPPMVRVVSIGVPVKDLLSNPANPAWRQYSIEFCGGTHLPNAADAGTFAITAEESVSKGIRRLVALTGDAARQAVTAGREIDRLIEQGRRAPDEIVQPIIASLQDAITATVPLRAKRRAQAAVAELQSRHKAYEKSHKAAGGGLDVAALSSALLEKSTPLGPGKLVVGEVPNAPTDQLLSIVDSLKKRAGSYGIVLISANEGRVNIVAAVSDDLVAKGLKAGDWLRETAKIVGGKGGGRPQMAQGGGTDPTKVADAMSAAREFAGKSVT